MSVNEATDGGSSELPVEMICGYPVHPAASAYPLMEGADWENLLASIRRDMKVQEPVVFRDGVLLDGRNRLKAKEVIEKETGKTVKWNRQEFDPEWGDVIEWVVNRNIRRNLTPDQLAVIATDIHAIRERELAAERKKQSQFGSNKARNESVPMATPNPGSPLGVGVAGVSDAAGGIKTTIKLRNPTTAAAIAKKAGPGVKRHHIESVFKIQKELGPEPIDEIRRGRKEIREVKKTIPKPPKPELPLDKQVEKGWEKFKKWFTAADLPQVRVLLGKLMEAERAEMDGKRGAK